MGPSYIQPLSAPNKETVMKTLNLLLLLAYAMLAAGCNTMEGLGKDITLLGDKITGKAQEEKAR
jgi:predicted small secreted protein